MKFVAITTRACTEDIAGSFLFSGPEDAVHYRAASLCMPDTALTVIEPFLRLQKDEDRAAVISMWSQWYFALLLTPWTRIAVLHGWRLPIAAREIRFTQSETAVPEKFILPSRGEKIAPLTDIAALFQQVMDSHLQPVCRTLAQLSGIKPGLFWNNAAIRIAHGITLAEEKLAELARQTELKSTMEKAAVSIAAAKAFLAEKYQGNGDYNPLYRPISLVDGESGPRIIRRLCCLRYKLNGLEYCPSCPLPLADERKSRRRALLK